MPQPTRPYSFMELCREYTLEQLLKFLNVTLDTLMLPCHFCSSFMDLNNKASYLASQLKVIVKDCCFKGACIKCRRKLAFAERQKYQVCVGEADLVEAMVGSHVINLTVRCSECLALLTASEKLDAKCELQTFILVRHMWRTSCRACRTPAIEC
ncbi:E6 [Micromys minutus papillomavirus 1]|uniref:Protein E6 n=2 Tax=Micromys minutus papillomavirus TaxID=10568 RepID=VE6_MMPV|nr:E6 [Micromys minutus papillomavirus 1]P30734.1 RecName: Full=Protein E6 [Micromys minutus papillomavirus 1]ABB85352.1 E6 [Micromys minutus papillomavirus 1]